ncbi:hypothetical protein [Pedobacter agri]|uniref:hypothetical protein n=1 Tax=Pedobacter agri TaxID=454586 RepID=UPI00292E3F48|nr:hypothetical protein [Pedobacter agri]
MMRDLRYNFTKSIFGILLLSMLMLKFFSYSISSFSSSLSAYSIEKNAEDNHDKEEESFDKAKKKLQLYESSSIIHEGLHYFNRLPLPTETYKGSVIIFLPRNVPTPPPDYFTS